MRCFTKRQRGTRNAGRGRRNVFFKKGLFPTPELRAPSPALLLLPSVAASCPLCQEAISKVHGLARGLGWSIALMLGTALGVVLTIAGVILHAQRRASKPS